MRSALAWGLVGLMVMMLGALSVRVFDARVALAIWAGGVAVATGSAVYKLRG